MNYARNPAVISFVMLVLLHFILGCETTLTGYKFKITAIYEAPISNFILIADTKGFVKAGRDVSEEYEGIVIIKPVSETDPGKVIKLHLTSKEKDVLYLIEFNEEHTVAWGLRDDYKSFKNILESAGYRYLSENEIRESVGAISGALSGPKGVKLKGQSEYLKVVNVKY